MRPLTQGNSGGALIDMQGRLIGINTAIFTCSGGSNGIGFAVPANMVKATLSGFRGRAGGAAWVGASLQAVTNDLALSMGLDRPTGVLVNGDPRRWSRGSSRLRRRGCDLDGQRGGSD